MTVKRITILCFVLAALCAPEAGYCSPGASISGVVTDAQTGERLPGANILIEGTSLGASTDLSGRYHVGDVPPGSYIVRVSYVGYKNLKENVTLTSGHHLTRNFKLEAVGVKGKTVIVTAQASGQNGAINQQLSSDRIMNAVSAARIRQLPDANAAESVARLPGVYLVRQGGEGTQLAVRGLAPQYNEVMIDGVEMAPTSSSQRSVNLSMISSSSLSGIELYKTATPDMDAAFLGGVVNFRLREAKQNRYGGPKIGLDAQGSYDGLQNSYNNYKFSGSIGDRFLDKRFGVFVQGIAQRIDLTANRFGGSYYLPAPALGQHNVTDLSSLTITYEPSEQQLYDATVVMDYRLPKGKIDFMNFLSRGLTKTEDRSQSYNLPPNNNINFGASYSPDRRDVVTDLLEYKQNFRAIRMDIKLSNSYSDYMNIGSWNANFSQAPAGLNSIPAGENPVRIAQAAAVHIAPKNMDFSGFSTSTSFNKSDNLTGSVDLSKDFALSTLVTGVLKFGGMYRVTSRYYSYFRGAGDMSSGQDQGARATILAKFPWMTKSPYNLDANGAQNFPLTLYEDNGYSYPKFLGGDYSLGVPSNFPLLSQSIGIVVKYMQGQPYEIASAYSPDTYANGANNYTGDEYRSAGYVMATLRVGPRLTIIPGVRYQALDTRYTAARYYDASAQNPYPNPLPHTDTTISEYHGYWLPDVIANYRPLSWLRIRASYTNTLSYPDFSMIVPRIDVFTGVPSVLWNNYALKPARSQNYDVGLSFSNNTIGLLTIDGFLKNIRDFIFSQTSNIANTSLYPGVPPSARGYALSTDINDKYPVNLWGAEVDWQTHFWYLPSVLSGLILDVNYTHIFSGAKYPWVVTEKQRAYPFKTFQVDTFYTDRLIDQPDDIINLSVGYDYMGFSTIASMIYQADVFSGTNFWPELRSNKKSYLRWDAVVKQDLPWPGLEVYLDLNDLNGASDIYLVQGSGYPTSESAYGMTADIGLRWDLQ